MVNKPFVSGIVSLGIGLAVSSLSSFVGHFAIFGSSAGFAQGFLDGLSVIAYGVAIYLLVRSRKASE